MSPKFRRIVAVHPHRPGDEVYAIRCVLPACLSTRCDDRSSAAVSLCYALEDLRGGCLDAAISWARMAHRDIRMQIDALEQFGL